MSGEKLKEPKREKRVSSYYKIEDGKIVRLLPVCDRCGQGFYMASHKDRYSCGQCGFTKYKV
jgi:small subunit ribosomal protein S27Ae